MQTLTFTQKLLRQRRFLSSLIPLLALFLGLGASQSAMAGIIISNSTVTISRNGGANENIAAAQFDVKRLGTYDINTGRLLLNGGSFTATATSTTVLAAGFIDYTVSDSLGTPASSGSIQLTGTPTSGSPRNFTLSTAAVNMLNGITTANPGYNISITFRATGRTGTSNTTVRDDNGGSGYNAFFNVTGVIPPPSTVTFSNQSVTVDQGNGSVNYPGTAFNTNLIDQKTGSTTTPAFDINTGQLVLKGGTVTTTETGTFVVNGAVLDYTLFDPSFAVVSNGTLQLTQTGVNNGVRNFSLTTGTTNLVSLIAAAGNGYTIQVSFHATYQVNGTGLPQRANDSNSYAATFSVAGNKTPPPTITANTVFINPNSGPSSTPGGPFNPGTNLAFGIDPPTTRPFVGADLSSSANNGAVYDVNNGRLILNGGTVSTTEGGASVISAVVLYFRTRLTSTGGGAFQGITLNQASGVDGGPKTFSLSTADNNLISTAAVTTPGAYSLDVYFQANGTRNGIPFTVTAPLSPGTYTATFTVGGTIIATTIWTGGKSDNWFDVANWSNGIPTATVNALVRDLGAGSTVSYPNIYSDVNVPLSFSGYTYDNTGKGPAEALSLTLGGTTQASRSILRLEKGRLNVHGDFNNDYASFVQRESTVVDFAGDALNNAGGNQDITGGTFVAVEISGTGIKRNLGLMEVSSSVTFNGGLLTTDISKPLVSLVVLADRAATNNNNGAQLINETDAHYLKGFVKTIRQSVLVGETRTYGNMGMTLTFTGAGSTPRNVEVTRNTVESYTPLNNRYSIRRVFGVRPSGESDTPVPLSANMIFHYLDSETKNLNGFNINGSTSTTIPGNGSIPESRLTIFLSTTEGNTFSLVGRDVPVDENSNIVTKTGVRNFSIFTLGDQDNPLPVRLTAFDAQRVGANTLITWQTASEMNSKGYDIQVSTNGTEYRTLTSVPSASPNSTSVTNYRYEDKESNKTGLRYYRLRQVDLDGKEAFFAPKSVSFSGKASETTLVAYPNPFNGDDELHLAVQVASAGKGQLRITDMTGRTIRQETVQLTSGLSDLKVVGLNDLKSGVYLIRVTLPTGENKNLKVVKQ